MKILYKKSNAFSAFFEQIQLNLKHYPATSYVRFASICAHGNGYISAVRSKSRIISGRGRSDDSDDDDVKSNGVISLRGSVRRRFSLFVTGFCAVYVGPDSSLDTAKRDQQSGTLGHGISP